MLRLQGPAPSSVEVEGVEAELIVPSSKLSILAAAIGRDKTEFSLFLTGSAKPLPITSHA